MSRESVAKIELDKAEARLRKNGDLARKIAEFLKNKSNEVDALLNGREKYIQINDKKYTETDLKKAKFGTTLTGLSKTIFGGLDDYADGQSGARIAVGVVADIAMFAITRAVPGLGWVTLWYDIGAILDKLDGNDSGIFDLRKQIQDLFTDDLSYIDMEAAAKGILRITMPDKTVYARPLSSSFFPYGVTPSGLLTGDYKDDVLLGGYGDDTLMGKGSGDLLIGGYGNDTYLATSNDIIRDDDHKGSVYFKGHKLTGILIANAL